MNKSELVDAVASGAGLEKRQAEAAVGVVVEEIVARAKAGEAVSIFGFGTFKPTARAARTGRNPQTGAPVRIAASRGVKFQPATAFKSALNAKKAAAKKAAPAKKAVAKKAVKKAVPAKRAIVKKAPAKKVVAKKAPARATLAKKR